METMNLMGKAGTKGDLCRVSAVRAVQVLRRERPGTGGFGADFGAVTTINPATDVAFLAVRAVG